jgi:hypothetical protein
MPRAGKHGPMSANPIETYLTNLAETRGTRANVAETSFYPALEQLLTEIGKTLNPRVRCVIHISGHGSGIPDGGLFTVDQFRRTSRDPAAAENPFLVQNPSRGVIEAKPPCDDLDAIVGSEQVERYWKRYGMVLVTNFRAFALVGKGPDGQPRALESFALAESESAFWALAAHPRKTADEHGARMLEYLKRVLLHNAPLASPQDVAALLASYAHDARIRVERADLPALTSLRQALEEALGLQFEGEKGEHFFRSTLVQTLFYGVFSAWVLWSRQRAAKSAGKKTAFAAAVRETPAPYVVAGAFDWKSAHHLLRVPMLRALFVQVADPARLGALGLIEVLDWSAAALNRVDRVEFFKSFDEGHAVQYFYEPFLCAFDPALRKELGVWYTPEEIVQYQVERVDAVLRSELGLEDGLADPQVVVLDPCCGTGAYLRAVLRRIAATLREKGGEALVAYDLKRAAMERVFGFEILPAPFVIAHLQLGLELETLGAPLSDRTDPPERAGVYLTNALTGWEPPKEKPKQIAFPGFDAERDAAGEVKQKKPILVILGNPPYNAFAGVSPDEENDLVAPYKAGLGKEWGIRKFNLDDLYIRFFRLAEKRVAEHGGRGVVSFISNFSYLGDPSYVVMRRRFLDEFDSLWFDCLNGDSRETGKLTPDGKSDPSVFSTDWNREGIRVGTAIALFVKVGEATISRHGVALPQRTEATSQNVGAPPRGAISSPKHVEEPTNAAGRRVHIRFRHFWGATKRAELLASLDAKRFNAQYETATPAADNRWSFRPSDVAVAYMGWPKVTELCAEAPSNGLMEKRGGALMDDDRNVLQERMKRYFDKRVSFEELKSKGHLLTHNAAAHDASKMRERVLVEEGFITERIVRYALRPFECCWCYYTGVGSVWNRPRPTFWKQCWKENRFLMIRPAGVAQPEGVPCFFTQCLGDNDALRGHAYFLPFRLKSGEQHAPGDLPGMEHAESTTANLSPAARAYLASLKLPDPDADQETAELIWFHALAIGYAPAYLSENADGIRQDWPRIPLPGFGGPTSVSAGERTGRSASLQSSAALGRQVAALLDMETPVPGVTTGKIRDDLRRIAIFERIDGKPANPDSGDFDLTAGWGHGGKGGVCMPGRGKVQRSDVRGQKSVTDLNPEPRTLNPEPGAYDIFLNSVACWRNIPEPVWDYTIGGYQVIKKWLSYREKPLLGRGLNRAEIQHVTDTARRLAALVGMQAVLDANYRAVAGGAPHRGVI